MGITIKALADELGVSKQAVYKRATGKLKSVLAPYMYTEYNRTCIQDAGADIIRKDFQENPCATPLLNTDNIRNIYGAHMETQNIAPEQIRNTSVSAMQMTQQHTEQSKTYTEQCSAPNTEHSGAYTEQFGTHTGKNNASDISMHIAAEEGSEACAKQCSVSNTERSGAYTEQCGTHTEQNSAPNTEQIRLEYETHTYYQEEIARLRKELEEATTALHQKELDLVRATSEKEKLDEVVNQLNQRIDDKNAQLNEQRALLQKTDDERKVLTASLFRNNELIEGILCLPLSKRIFGWKDIQNSITTSQNGVAGEFQKDDSIDLSPDDIEEK